MSFNIELVSSVNMYSASHAFIHMLSVNTCKFQSIFRRRVIIATLRLRLWLRGMHGSNWVKLREFFDPTHHGGLKKSNPTQPITGVQPNPTQPTWIGLGQVEPMGWAVFIFIIIFLLLLLLN